MPEQAQRATSMDWFAALGASGWWLTASAAHFASRARLAAARASSRAAFAFCSRCQRATAPAAALAAARAPATHGKDDVFPPPWLIAEAGAVEGPPAVRLAASKGPHGLGNNGQSQSGQEVATSWQLHLRDLHCCPATRGEAMLAMRCALAIAGAALLASPVEGGAMR